MMFPFTFLFGWLCFVLFYFFSAVWSINSPLIYLYCIHAYSNVCVWKRIWERVREWCESVFVWCVYVCRCCVYMCCRLLLLYSQNLKYLWNISFDLILFCCNWVISVIKFVVVVSLHQCSFEEEFSFLMLTTSSFLLCFI